MRLHYLSWLLLSVAILPVILAEPDVFGDYFDDGMKLVDISQDAALRSCLSDGKTADKTKAAYDECYGQGYDFDDLAKAGGDDDGLPEELEEKEGCFYKKMGWVSEDNVMDEALIAADMEGLEKEIQEGFTKDVGTCVAWTGSFGERRKRSVGMETGGEGLALEEVPSVMDSGRRAMGWVRKLVRKVRSPGRTRSGKENKCPKGQKKKKGKCVKRKRGKKGRKGNRQSRRRTANKKKKNNKGKQDELKRRRGRKRNTKVKKNGEKKPREPKRGNGQKNGKGKGRRGNKELKQKRKGGKKENKKDKNKEQNKSEEKKDRRKTEQKRNKKNNKSLPEAVYNKLWCIDLAIEQALEKCVEAKIQN